MCYRTLLLATGMWKPNIPAIEGIELTTGYDVMTTDPAFYSGKNVLVLGETAALHERFFRIRAAIEVL